MTEPLSLREALDQLEEDGFDYVGQGDGIFPIQHLREELKESLGRKVTTKVVGPKERRVIFAPDPLGGRADPLPDGEPFHLRGPRHYGEHHLSGRASRAKPSRTLTRSTP